VQFRRYKKIPKDYKGDIKKRLETGKTTALNNRKKHPVRIPS
jgi:hypothetical protein